MRTLPVLEVTANHVGRVGGSGELSPQSGARTRTNNT